MKTDVICRDCNNVWKEEDWFLEFDHILICQNCYSDFIEKKNEIYIGWSFPFDNGVQRPLRIVLA